MSKEYDRILKLALSLPKNEFLSLLQELLGKVQDIIDEELNPEIPWETEELSKELDRRIEEIQSGKVKPIPGEKVMKKLRKKTS